MPARVVRPGQEIIGIQIKKKEMKVLFADDMSVYRKPERMNQQQKLLELISDYGKFVGHNVNKSSLLSYISSMNRWNLKLKVQYHLY